MTDRVKCLKLYAFAFISVFLIFFSSGTGLKAESETKPVIFGVSLDLSGSYKVMAQMQKNGFLLWQKHVNEQRGILGRPVEVMISNNKGSLEVLYEHYSRMLADPEIDFVFCPYSSEQAGAVAELFESSPLAQMVVDRDGRILDVNEQFVEFTGYEIKELLELDTWLTAIISNRTDFNGIVSDWHNAAAGSRVAHQVQIKDKLGNPKKVEFSFSFLPDGRLTCFLVDMTEKELQEEENRRMETNLKI